MRAQQASQYTDRRLKHVHVVGHVQVQMVRNPVARLAELLDAQDLRRERQRQQRRGDAGWLCSIRYI